MYVAIRLRSGKIELIVDEVIMYSCILHLQHAYILASPCQIHIKMRDIFHLITPLFRNAKILRQHDTYIVTFLVKIFWK